MFVSLWDSMDALAEHTGGDPERPKYYHEDRAALLELPEQISDLPGKTLKPHYLRFKAY